jgi:hypothetical protein
LATVVNQTQPVGVKRLAPARFAVPGVAQQRPSRSLSELSDSRFRTLATGSGNGQQRRVCAQTRPAPAAANRLGRRLRLGL